MFLSTPASADYRLQTGDVLAISVFGVSELHAEGAAVDVDGKISFPLIGKISAAGSTAAELRDKIATLFADQVFGSSGSGPRSTSGGITPREILITVTEYRPVYVSGDVLRSGAQAFRPGLTVRQAISLAGGVNADHGIETANSPGSDHGATDRGTIQAQYSALWIDFARETALIWRLEQERDRQDNKVQQDAMGQIPTGAASSINSIMGKIPIPATLLSQITIDEADQLQLNKEASTSQRNYLEQTIGQIDAQLAVLIRQQGDEQHESELDLSEFDKVRGLYNLGWVTTDRMASLRRTAFTATSQKVQTSSLIAQAQRERSDLTQRLLQLDSDHRISVAHDIEEANVNLAKIRSSLQALGDKVLFASDRGGDAGTPEHEGRLTISIFRTTDGVSTPITATEDMALLPGDVVTVTEGNNLGASLARVERQTDAPTR
jgi:polysaccharide export outer membrane protein